MTLLSYRPAKAIGYGLLIWLIGFVWGSIVLMVPGLQSVDPIPLFSNNPAISLPILVVYSIIVFYMAKSYISGVVDKIGQGYKLGIIIFLVNIVLDGLVYVLILGSDNYFSFLSVWISYVLLLIIPRIVAFRSQEGPTSEL
jgi:hypothetical protein